jgi:hypothetical protein
MATFPARWFSLAARKAGCGNPVPDDECIAARSVRSTTWSIAIPSERGSGSTRSRDTSSLASSRCRTSSTRSRRRKRPERRDSPKEPGEARPDRCESVVGKPEIQLRHTGVELDRREHRAATRDRRRFRRPGSRQGLQGLAGRQGHGVGHHGAARLELKSVKPVAVTLRAIAWGDPKRGHARLLAYPLGVG